MKIRFTRLGLGDWLDGLASVALLVVLFALPWFAVHANFMPVLSRLGETVSANGWQTYTVVGPLTVLVCGLGLAQWLLQLTRSAPALPILVTVVQAPLSLVLLIWLIVRVLIFPPSMNMPLGGTGNALTARPGAYIAVALAAAIVLGVLISLRRDGVDPADTPAQIETFQLS